MQIDKRSDVNDISVLQKNMKYFEKPQRDVFLNVDKRKEQECDANARKILRRCVYQRPMDPTCPKFSEILRNCSRKRKCSVDQVCTNQRG
jgi:hypothetical protein